MLICWIQPIYHKQILYEGFSYSDQIYEFDDPVKYIYDILQIHITNIRNIGNYLLFTICE